MSPRLASLPPLVVALIVTAGSSRAQPGEPLNSAEEVLVEQLDRLLTEESEGHDEALSNIVALGEEAAPTLERMAVDQTAHPRHRAGVVYALGRIGAASSIPILEQLWESGFEHLGGGVAAQLAVALAEYGELTPLRTLVAFGDEILGTKAAVQLGLRHDSQSLEVLQAAYAGEVYARMRPFFAIALGLLGDPRGEPVLRAGLAAIELRNHCAIALGALGYESEVIFELGFAMNDLDPLVRLSALTALVRAEPSSLDETLAEASSDPDQRVRELAESTLQQRTRRRRR